MKLAVISLHAEIARRLRKTEGALRANQPLAAQIHLAEAQRLLSRRIEGQPLKSPRRPRAMGTTLHEHGYGYGV